jgi:hypothetical protein
MLQYEVHISPLYLTVNEFAVFITDLKVCRQQFGLAYLNLVFLSSWIRLLCLLQLLFKLDSIRLFLLVNTLAETSVTVTWYLMRNFEDAISLFAHFNAALPLLDNEITKSSERCYTHVHFLFSELTLIDQNAKLNQFIHFFNAELSTT